VVMKHDPRSHRSNNPLQFNSPTTIQHENKRSSNQPSKKPRIRNVPSRPPVEVYTVVQ
jgi:hypothetical protein